MAWCPFARKLELQPESDDQPAIRPTQLIFHSVAAPWDEVRLYEYWRDSTSLESHFGVDYDGSLGQFIGTETRADANARANLRADGTGAVSAETASRTDSSDPWTVEQLETLTNLGVWMHERHEVPLRICRSWTDPGFGYHAMFPEWSTGGTDCPGPARIRQFREVLFPRIVARAKGIEDMALTDAEISKIAAKVLAGVAKAAWMTDGVLTVPAEWTSADNPQWAALSILVDQGKRVRGLETAVKGIERAGLSEAQITAIADRVAASPALAEAVAARVAELLAARLAS
ncbi:peptidoglycan recognition protein family protein [Streptomyces sp. HUCO-GS316]|uniref:peptidoglycan recognition protein family protein n=1 Tax=Streptomyces sp. HUCO-GS316 TaxID=2692198 RepID=UPI001EFFCCB6|nr:N-acetylmuramoyl-L-alanine amidase [Streptomyces sp. HUCO-GS316]